MTIGEKNILILTIGNNPLPVYVVLNYLLNNQNNQNIPKPNYIILTHSGDTERFARKILETLFTIQRIRRDYRRENFICVNIGDNSRDLADIEATITDTLENIQSIKSIHLNYTGGTKPMALGSYIASYKISQELNLETFILSNLDPKECKIKSIINFTQITNSEDLRCKISLNVKNILDLHDIEHKGSKPKFKCYSKEVAKKISDFKKNEENDDFFEEWGRIKDNLESPRDNVNYNVSLQNFREIMQDPPLKEIYERLEQRERNFWKNTAIFFYGGWLEDLVYNVFLQYKTSEIFNEISHLGKNVAATYDNRPMELDTIFIIGYQLIAISVTTSSNFDILKKKAFEVIHRAEELGGEHSIAVLICSMSEDDDYFKEMKADFSVFLNKRRFFIFGSDFIEKELSRKEEIINKDLLSIFKQKKITKKKEPDAFSQLDFEKAQDVLILNIGHNPLPNYIVAEYLLTENNYEKYLQNPSIIILLHSNETEKQAKSIEQHLQRKFNNNIPYRIFVNLGDNQRDILYIKERIKEVLKKINPINSIHLNYTGGTKPMALGSYMAIQELEKEKRISDLNPNNFKIKINTFENLQNNKEIPENGDLRDKVLFSVEDLMNLHCFEFENCGIINDPLLLNIQNVIDSILDNNQRIIYNTNINYRNGTQTIPFILINGYELFLILITLSEKLPILKKEVFEAQSRAEQLGGEHAKAIIITCRYNNGRIEELRKDLALFNAQKNCFFILAIENNQKDLNKKDLGQDLKTILNEGRL